MCYTKQYKRNSPAGKAACWTAKIPVSISISFRFSDFYSSIFVLLIKASNYRRFSPQASELILSCLRENIVFPSHVSQLFQHRFYGTKFSYLAFWLNRICVKKQTKNLYAFSNQSAMMNAIRMSCSNIHWCSRSETWANLTPNYRSREKFVDLSLRGCRRAAADRRRFKQ